MHVHTMDQARPGARALMACLGDGSRFRLVRALIGGARCVTDLASEVGLSQSCTTRHLQMLERRRVVTGTRDGKRVLYRIRDDEPALMPLLEWALDSGAEGVGVRATAVPHRSRPGTAARVRSTPRSASTPATGSSQGILARRDWVPARGPIARSGTGPAAEPTGRPSTVPAPEKAPVAGSDPATELEAASRRRSSDIEDFLL